MEVVEQAAVIGASIELVREAMNDLESVPRWATVEGRVDNPRGQGIGRSYDWSFRVSGLQFKGKLEVIDQSDSRLVTKSTGDIDSIWTIDLTPLSRHSTAIRVVVEYVPPHKLLEPLADLVVRQLASPEAAHENMNRFKLMVEQQAINVSSES